MILQMWKLSWFLPERLWRFLPTPCIMRPATPGRVVVLPKGTNLDLTKKHENATDEEKLLFGTNKWVIAHPDAKIEGAFNGIIGENLKLD